MANPYGALAAPVNPLVQQILADPTIAAWLKQNGTNFAALNNPPPAVRAALATYADQLPPGMHFDPQTQNLMGSSNFFTDMVIPAAEVAGFMVGGSAVAGALTGGGAATAGGGASAAGSGAAAGGGSAAAGGGASIVGLSPPATMGLGTIGGVGKTIASGAPSWLNAAAGPLIGGVTNLIGAGMAANANTEGAALNNKYLEDALAYEKQKDAYLQTTEANRYGSMMAAEAPYRAGGASATSAMTQFLGLPASAPNAAPMAPPTMPSSVQAPAAPVNRPAMPAGAPGLVTMKAPDNSIQQVKLSDVPHFESLGAVRV